MLIARTSHLFQSPPPRCPHAGCTRTVVLAEVSIGLLTSHLLQHVSTLKLAINFHLDSKIGRQYAVSVIKDANKTVLALASSSRITKFR
jgi:hypothetical protein